MKIIEGAKLFNEAMDLVKTNTDLGRAEHIFNSLLNEDFNSEILIYAIALIAISKGNYGCGINLLERVVQIKTNFHEALNNLGCCYKSLSKTKEARRCFELALSFNQNPDYISNLGGTFTNNGTPDKAIYYLNKCLKIKPFHQSSLNNLSISLLEKGNWQRGFALYDYRAATGNHKSRDYHPSGTPTWSGTPGQTVVVYGEQGIGDEIMFASMLQDIIPMCNVILDAHPRLADIFRNSFPGIAVYGTRKESEIEWQKLHKIDAKIEIGSLAKFFRNSDEQFPRTPYLKADDKITEKMQARLAQIGKNGFNIGISWKGGTLKTQKDERTIDLETWVPFFKKLPSSINLISLQYRQDAEADIRKFNKKNPNIKIHHWRDVVDNYDLTAGLVQSLDMVVSVPQSVVHLAGALSTCTFQLTPYKHMWQMGPYGKDMPWYGCVKNIWQDDTCNWDLVIQKLIKHFDLYIGGNQPC